MNMACGMCLSLSHMFARVPNEKLLAVIAAPPPKAIAVELFVWNPRDTHIHTISLTVNSRCCVGIYEQLYALHIYQTYRHLMGAGPGGAHTHVHIYRLYTCTVSENVTVSDG